MALCPEHPKRDQNPKFTPLSETTSIPVFFICESPPRDAGAKMFLELTHVSLFADYGDLEVATTVEPVLSGTVFSDQF